MKKSSLILASIVSLVLIGCGGGGSGDPSTDPVVETVTKTIGVAGGAVELPSGFKVTFPEGALSTSLPITLSTVDIPGALPSGIQAKSSAFNISANIVKLNLPAELQFPGSAIDASASRGEVGVFRWNTETRQWNFAGGGFMDGVVRTKVDAFSTYIIGAGGLVHKPVEFSQISSFNMIVKPYEYEFTHPDQSSRIASQMSAIVWKLGSPGDISHDIMYLPQGKYSFCAEWWNDKNDGDKHWEHKFVGDLPASPAVSLGESSSELVPPLVNLGDEFTPTPELGRCPEPRIFVPVDQAQEFDFLGEYNALSLDPERTYEELHAIFTFKSDHSLILEQWADGVYSDGTGTWQFDSSTNIFSFAVDEGASFSGVVSGNTDSFELSGTWSNGSPGVTLLSRP